MGRSSFDKRMHELSLRMPPLPKDPLLLAAIQRQAEMDLGFRQRMRKLQERRTALALARMEGGSGFVTASTIRHFFLEYFWRLGEFGLRSFPTSFNVVESFLSFREELFAFDIRNEREHVLRLYDYFDWYTAGQFPDDPGTLRDLIPDGIIYEYNAVSPANDFAIGTAESTLRILGIGLVRHGAELSGMLIAGETPPYPPDDKIAGQLKDMEIVPGHEGVIPDPSSGLQDRYVADLVNHARVIMLARFDIDRRQYDVRYVNLDLGPSYLVLSDDPTILTSDRDGIILGIGGIRLGETRRAMEQKLVRYDPLFSALASLIYLPAFFIDRTSSVGSTRFVTELQVNRASTKVRNAVRQLGLSEVPFFRDVQFLVGAPPISQDSTKRVAPPELEYKTSGYWMPINPGSIGEDRDGNSIVGKTWVERTDSWTKRSLESFILSQDVWKVVGPNPGRVYVMRSGSHYADLYKIGLTRRTPTERATELSSATGVPTGFEVLAQWDVGDCVAIEDQIHRQLAHRRVNKRREFFAGPLPELIAVINSVIREAG